MQVTPSAPKVRQVLALLALRANDTVPHHQLVEELWEERPPTSAATTLQTYIYQLRKLPGLGHQSPVGPGRDVPALLTTPGGYRLSLPSSCTDVKEFDELVIRARRAMEEGAITEGAEALHRALAVWRGPVLADLSMGPVVGIDILRLTEKRYEVLEERIDADLVLGRHHRLTSELSALAADHPTREGLHAKLMLALHRAGRRSEALEVFQRLRRVLADELGIEPGADIQRLHQQVLAGDRALDPPRPTGSPGSRRGVPAPRRPRAPEAATPPASVLPPDVPLIGRSDEVDLAVGLLTEEPEGGFGEESGGPRCVAVVGPPGVGVTAFGVHVAHRLRTAFPDGRFHVSFGDPDDPLGVDDVLASLLGAAGFRPSGLPAERAERARLFRSWTAGRRVLIVVDEVTTARQITDLLPAEAGSALLVTGHHRLHDTRFTARMELRPLGTRQALELIRQALGRERLHTDPIGLRELLDLCGGLPGPLLGAGALLALRPHWTMRQLIDWMSRMCSEPAVVRRHQPWRCVARCCSALHPRLRDVLARLAGEDGFVTVEQAAVLLETGIEEAGELLEELVECFLVDADISTDPTTSWFFQYRVPPLVRMVFRSSRDPVAARV
ncbi:AfsR/SARP family transcriptional regulator [Streptomyces calidiresistens]|uniref:AfsR/SARP family transcriptional regulator n=1 Tax=Streptomyces calidiresistens TaxID=1485586 RepID=UPI0015FCD1B5|nr:BTAD domain-containing putative transcriptional regulator [Streptomyces calidiresistens]